jgi:pantoate--beta-alanine ligase
MSSGSAAFPVFRDVPSLRELRKSMYIQGRQVGFVPTMGALHDGHLSLVKHALQENTDVFISIFVNPTQFGVNEDLDSYPKTWEEDISKLGAIQEEFAKTNAGKSIGTNKICGIFAPTVKVMYPTLPPSSEIDGHGSFVTITPLSKWLEGSSRPVFFRGVATVCTKLFNVVQPDRVYFGQKDGQQSVLIRRMVKDFHIPTEVRVIPTTREPDGLAMSSRNVYLGERRRKDVSILSKALFAAEKAWVSGVRSAKELRQAAFDIFDLDVKRDDGTFGKSCRLEIDYIALSDPDDMSVIEESALVDAGKGAIISAAMKVWPVDEPRDQTEREQISVRLIDNVILKPNPR